MDHGRMHLSAVILPNRTVLATGGSAMEEAAHGVPKHGQIYDPTAGTWTHTADSRGATAISFGRTAHTGWQGGHCRLQPGAQDRGAADRMYLPPCLFYGPRPTLALTTDTATFGGTINATVSAGVHEISLMRPSACTHSCDNEQRLLDVAFTTGPGNEVTLQMPNNANLAAPGWYLVFALDHHGVPSSGQWLQLVAGVPARPERLSAERAKAKKRTKPRNPAVARPAADAHPERGSQSSAKANQVSSKSCLRLNSSFSSSFSWPSRT
jgi:Domain of unknown function (DUF1929)